jgi:hypothetical protein
VFFVVHVPARGNVVKRWEVMGIPGATWYEWGNLRAEWWIFQHGKLPDLEVEKISPTKNRAFFVLLRDEVYMTKNGDHGT